MQAIDTDHQVRLKAFASLQGFQGTQILIPRSGMDPGQEIVHEAFREAFGPVQALEEEAAEDFHDGGGIGPRKRQELSIAIENAIRNHYVGSRTMSSTFIPA